MELSAGEATNHGVALWLKEDLDRQFRPLRSSPYPNAHCTIIIRLARREAENEAKNEAKNEAENEAKNEQPNMEGERNGTYLAAMVAGSDRTVEVSSTLMHCNNVEVAVPTKVNVFQENASIQCHYVAAWQHHIIPLPTRAH